MARRMSIYIKIKNELFVFVLPSIAYLFETLRLGSVLQLSTHPRRFCFINAKRKFETII